MPQNAWDRGEKLMPCQVAPIPTQTEAARAFAQKEAEGTRALRMRLQEQLEKNQELDAKVQQLQTQLAISTCCTVS